MVIQKIIDQLSALDWKDMNETSIQAKKIFDKNSDTKTLLDSSHEFFHNNKITNTERSHETGTHFKWLLYKDPDAKFSMWLHEYKEADQRQNNYAEVNHNHRYWIISKILQGGFTNKIYDVARSDAKENTYDDEKNIQNDTYEPGDSYIMSPSIIHSLGDLKNKTLTLLIRSEASKEFSESFVGDSEIKRHYPFSSRKFPGQ